MVWDSSIRDYPPEELRRIFAVHGVVEDVVIRSSKKKRQVGCVHFLVHLYGRLHFSVVHLAHHYACSYIQDLRQGSAASSTTSPQTQPSDCIYRNELCWLECNNTPPPPLTPSLPPHTFCCWALVVSTFLWQAPAPLLQVSRSTINLYGMSPTEQLLSSDCCANVQTQNINFTTYKLL